MAGKVFFTLVEMMFIGPTFFFFFFLSKFIIVGTLIILVSYIYWTYLTSYENLKYKKKKFR